MVVARGSPPSFPNAALLLKMETAPPYRGLVLYLNASPAPSAKAAIRIEQSLLAPTSSDFGDSTPHVFGGRLFGASPSVLEIRVNQLVQGAIVFSTRVDISAPGLGLVIGYRGVDASSGFYPFEGAISEIVMVKGPLSDGELAALEFYLMAKYRRCLLTARSPRTGCGRRACAARGRSPGRSRRRCAPGSRRAAASARGPARSWPTRMNSVDPASRSGSVRARSSSPTMRV